MRDKTIIALVVLATVLVTGHLVDHVIRGDLPLPLTLDSLVFIAVSLAIYAVTAGGLYLYLKDKVGPRYWTIIAGAGLVLSWLSHFSPYTDRTPGFILSRYASPSAGWVALACLFALMIVLVIGIVHGAYLWRREVSTGIKRES